MSETTAPETELQRNEREATETLAERQRAVDAAELRKRAAEANLAVAESDYRAMPSEPRLEAVQACRGALAACAAELAPLRTAVERANQVAMDLRVASSKVARAARWEELRPRIMGEGLTERIASIVAAVLAHEELRDAALDALDAEVRTFERERREAEAVAPGGPASLGHLRQDWAEYYLGLAVTVARAERNRPASGRPRPRPRGLVPHVLDEHERQRLASWLARVTTRPA